MTPPEHDRERKLSASDKPAAGLGATTRGALGVHLDFAALRLVEVVRGHVVRWARVPYPPGVEPGKETFPEFLKQSLAEYVPAYHRPPVWVIGPIPSLQVRFLTLPKVRAAQVSNLVFWTFRKEIPFDSAQTVFDYDLEGDVAAAGQARKMDATAYTATQADLDALANLFESIGIPVEGIVIPSFALRNLLRGPLAHGPGTSLALFVGMEDSALLIFKGRQVVSHRVFKTGMNVLLDVVRERQPDCPPAKAFQLIGWALGSGPDAPPPEDAQLVEYVRQNTENIQASFGRLVQQVERSLSAYLTGKTGEEIHGIHVAGALAGLPTLVKELGGRLGMTSQPIHLLVPPLLQGKGSGLATPEEGGLMALALGAALSDNDHTPNLLHTYVKREQKVRLSRTKRLIMALGVVALAAIGLLHLFSGRYNDGLRRELKGCQAQIAKYAPYPNRAMIEALMIRAMADNLQMKAMASRNLMAVALNQIARETPVDIRLTAMVVERAEKSDAEIEAARRKKKDVQEGAIEIQIHVEGQVEGEPGIQRSKLAAYQMRLDATGLLDEVSLARAEEGRVPGGQILAFALDMKAVSPAPAAVPAAAPPPQAGKP